jgi:hypothetical protein
MSTHDELPIPDYDQLNLGTITHRIRSLTQPDLERLLEHERATAHRVQVEEIMQARVKQLADGAEPSGGDPTQAPPVGGGSGGSSVSPQQSPDDNTPLRHGVASQTPKRGRS